MTTAMTADPGQVTITPPRRRLALWLAGIVLLGVAVAVTLVALTFDPNAYKDRISAWVKDQTGRELRIGGKIEISFFPWLGVRLNRIEVNNVPGFAPTPFLQAELAQLRVKLIPLLQGQWVIDIVVLERAVLHLSRDSAGRSNWEDLTREHRQGANLAVLSLGGLAVTNASLILDDQQQGRHFALEKLTLRTGAIVSREAFDLKLGFDTALSPQYSGHFEAKGKGVIDLDRQHYELRDALIMVQLKGEHLPQQHFDLQLSGDMSADINRQTLLLDNVKIETAGLTMLGRLQATPISNAARLTGRLKITPFSPRDFLRRLDVSLPSGLPANSLQQAAFDATLVGTLEEIHLAPLKLQLDDTLGSGEISFSMKEKPLVSVNLAFDQLDLGRYVAPAEGQPNALPIETLRGLPVQGQVRVARLKFGDVQADDATLSLGTSP